MTRLVAWLTKLFGITNHADFSYLILHINDHEVHTMMRKYRSERFDQLCGIVLFLTAVNVIHKFILVLMATENAYFFLILGCCELFIAILWRGFRRTRL